MRWLLGSPLMLLGRSAVLDAGDSPGPARSWDVEAGEGQITIRAMPRPASLSAVGGEGQITITGS